MDTDHGHGHGNDADDGTVDADGPAYSTGWVARRLGIAPPTLRTWHRRYGIGPTGRTEGGHRRFLPSDLDRLERMRRLVLTGMPTADAARASADPAAAPPAWTAVDNRRGPVTPSKHIDKKARCLSDAAMSLDQPVVELALADSLRRRGVVSTWTQLIVPVLHTMGQRYAHHGDGIGAEHLFTECVRTALTRMVTKQHSWDGYPPVILACPDSEQHSLPLHALAAALAKQGCPSRVLGASVPIDALATAIRHVTPRAVFVWAQTPLTARPGDLEALPQRRPPTPVIVGGPGWNGHTLPVTVTRVDSLSGAVAAVSLGLTAIAR